MIRQWMERLRDTMIDARRVPRRREGQSAVLTANGADHRVRVMDLSEQGAMIEGGATLGPGTYVSLQLLDREPLQGQVRWSQDGRIGLRFNAPEKPENAGQDGQ